MKSLVLPAADEAKSIWTNKFGFKKLEHDEVCNFFIMFLVKLRCLLSVEVTVTAAVVPTD